MKITELLRAQLEVEADRTRRALERTPEGREDWKPHEKSMTLGRLAMLVARLPSWLALIIKQDELDLKPPGGSNVDQRPLRTTGELVQALVAGRVVTQNARHVVLRDTFMHLSHHRGQLTVYLRLNDVPVPAIYGPSADDARFD